MTLRYDERRLTEMLDRLPGRFRATFASTCVERLLPAYVNYSSLLDKGNPAALAGILDRLWNDLMNRRHMTDADVQASIDACMALVPEEDDTRWVVESAAAEDAAVAMVYALTCLRTGESQRAAWAARCAYEALDHLVINTEDIDLHMPGAEEKVLSHPLVQAELARQQRDIDELGRVIDEDTREVAARLRDRARAEAASFFGATS